MSNQSSHLKDVMTKKVHTIPMGSTVDQAKAKMTELRVRHLPVSDPMDDIVGMVSQRDLMRLNKVGHLPVELFMASPVVFVESAMSLRSAILKMLENKISAILIADEKEDLAGIVTTDDLLWHLAHRLEQEEKGETPLIGLMAKQTIGQIAQTLSNMGI